MGHIRPISGAFHRTHLGILLVESPVQVEFNTLPGITTPNKSDVLQCWIGGGGNAAMTLGLLTIYDYPPLKGVFQVYVTPALPAVVARLNVART